MGNQFAIDFGVCGDTRYKVCIHDVHIQYGSIRTLEPSLPNETHKRWNELSKPWDLFQYF